MKPIHSLRERLIWSAAFLLVAALGIFLRTCSFEPINKVGFDETLYNNYVEWIDHEGIRHYPDMVGLYVQKQRDYPIVLLPPTRATFILCSSIWHALFGGTALACIRAVSCAASILILLLSCAFAWRLQGRPFALAILALMSVAPTQVYMAHRALIDGFFSLITLLVIWSLWEILQVSRRPLYWLALYGISLALLVMTKENAAFVYAAIFGLFIVNRWLRFGQVSRSLLLVTVLAPVVGVVLLALIAGGFDTLATVYSLNVAKSMHTPYAIDNGNGPWFRYLSDLMLVNPAVLVFAIGGAFSLDRTQKAGWYFLGFIVFTYIWMCNVTYGMNLRYANMWDFPLCFLALTPVFFWAKSLPTDWKRRLFLVATVTLLAVFELSNYLRIFVANEVYDPTPTNLLHALDMFR